MRKLNRYTAFADKISENQLRAAAEEFESDRTSRIRAVEQIADKTVSDQQASMMNQVVGKLLKLKDKVSFPKLMKFLVIVYNNENTFRIAMKTRELQQRRTHLETMYYERDVESENYRDILGHSESSSNL